MSSSAHLSLLPWLAGWRWDELDPETAQELRGGAPRRGRGGAPDRAAAGDRGRASAVRRPACRRGRALLRAAGGVGYRFERQIERRLGGPAGDGRRARSPERSRWRSPTAVLSGAGRGEATPSTASPSGSARPPRWRPACPETAPPSPRRAGGASTAQHANLLSRTVALPVIVGATLLKGVRLRRRGVEPGLGRAMAAGVAASFASTLASQKLIDAGRARPRPVAVCRLPGRLAARCCGSSAGTGGGRGAGASDTAVENGPRRSDG